MAQEDITFVSELLFIYPFKFINHTMMQKTILTTNTQPTLWWITFHLKQAFSIPLAHIFIGWWAWWLQIPRNARRQGTGKLQAGCCYQSSLIKFSFYKLVFSYSILIFFSTIFNALTKDYISFFSFRANAYMLPANQNFLYFLQFW